jgi:hypothetical protein
VNREYTRRESQRGIMSIELTNVGLLVFKGI